MRHGQGRRRSSYRRHALSRHEHDNNVLDAVSGSQSTAALKVTNLGDARALLVKKWPALPGEEPGFGSDPVDAASYITRSTLAYAHSLVISSLCYASPDPLVQGRAAALSSVNLHVHIYQKYILIHYDKYRYELP